jgi:hypothetical protein
MVTAGGVDDRTLPPHGSSSGPERTGGIFPSARMRCHSIDPTPPDAAKLVGKRGKRSVEQIAARNDHRVDPRVPVTLYMLPEHLSYQPFSSVPLDGAADFARCDDPQARCREPVGQQEQREMPALESGTPFEDLPKLTTAPHAAISREAVVTRHGTALNDVHRSVHEVAGIPALRGRPVWHLAPG